MFVEKVRNTRDEMMETLKDHVEHIIGEINLADKEDTLEKQMHTKTKNVFHDEFWKIQRHYAKKK